jgi:hypothetical protein
VIGAVLAAGAVLLAGCGSGPAAAPGGSADAQVTAIEHQLDGIQSGLDADG